MEQITRLLAILMNQALAGTWILSNFLNRGVSPTNIALLVSMKLRVMSSKSLASKLPRMWSGKECWN